MVDTPISRSRAAVFGPQPHRASTARGARKSASAPGATILMARGGASPPPALLAALVAILAISLLLPPPMEQGRCNWRSMRSCKARAIKAGSPGEPVISRKASSIETGSTIGVNSCARDMTRAETPA